MTPEAELRHYERMQKEQHFSYELTQRLTYYVISAEFIFCGYVLLNSDKFGVIKYSSALFLLAGIAALSGVLWRFGYNQNQHDIAHETITKNNRYILIAQLTAYWAYIVVSIIFFISLLAIGYSHIRGIESPANGHHEKPPVVKTEKEITPELDSPALKEKLEELKKAEEVPPIQNKKIPKT